MNDKIHTLVRLDEWIYVTVLAVFVAAAIAFGMYGLAAAEAVIFLIVFVFTMVNRKNKEKTLDEYIEKVVYEAKSARDSTLQTFPLPISAFRMDDYKIIWGNDHFFTICGAVGMKLDAKISDLVENFSASWISEGKSVCPDVIEINGRKYKLHGKFVSSENKAVDKLMGIIYWLDVTEFENIKLVHENTRPVAGIIVIDNLDEMTKNQPDRVKNDIRDAVEDMLNQWCEQYSGIVRRYDRDRYIAFFEKQNLERMKTGKFPIIERMHGVESPGGINASISIGFGIDGETLHDNLQFADIAIELALTRGGDQAVIKDRTSFEFYGGRGFEVEKRTKVKSRVMANTLMELMRDSTRVIVMGHRYSDLDSIGAAVGVCCLAKKCEVRYNIAVDETRTAASPLIEKLRSESEYGNVFITCAEARARADARTLLVIVDTNRPETIEDEELLASCGRVAVIDHHRVAASYIKNAALGFVEPYASSACELITEILQETLDGPELQRYEAEAILSGIVLDTKSFTIRTGERTFDAAAYLRRAGADTADVKKLLQTGIDSTIARYRILQNAELYRGIAIAAPEEPQERVVAAQAADELLDIAGVDASIVVFPDGNGGIFASARSIGSFNVQILMEKLGGGGNRSAAAAQIEADGIDEAKKKLYSAIDEYMG
ncbi:MAG: DHH family phosphoesterase [Eubacteriales bacterium]|nr:DHH family phosphoesterase [Eubacteriales bacterium]